VGVEQRGGQEALEVVEYRLIVSARANDPGRRPSTMPSPSSRACASFLLVYGLIACGRPSAQPPPNILLISIDSLRADHVRAYGYERETTPNLDLLARQGTLFETVIADSSWTIPSHATLLTGVGSRTHGMQTGYQRLSPSRPTLARLLKASGYRTAGVFSGPYLHPVFGFSDGFDSYESVIPNGGATPIAPTGGAETLNRLMVTQEAAFQSPTSSLVSDKAIRFLEDVGTRPFFLFLHYFDVHYDYDPPELYWRRFDPDYHGDFTGRDFIHNRRIHADMDARDLHHLVARYDGEILFTDEHVGRVINALDHNGLGRNTVVVVTSDHGDEFFEHGNRGHRHSLYEEVLRVPLVVRWPGRVRAGARIGGLVRHADVAPTLLGYAGVAAKTEGSDLRTSLERGAVPPTVAAVSRLVRTPVKNEWVSVRTADLKYIVLRENDRSTEMLFDLRTDPGETDAVVAVRRQQGGPDPSPGLTRVRSLLHELGGRGKSDRVVDLDSSGGLSPELVERLRALGYVQ
jgi:arylsulfatase A-like enzyme